MKRREFLKHTAAVASLSAVGHIASARANNASQQCHAGVVLVDERFSDSQRFAKEFATRGAKIISLDEDIGRLWYGELRAHCLQSGSFIAGLTQHTELFVSREFAREHGRRLQELGEHECRGRSTLTHTVRAGSLDLRTCEAWPEELVTTIVRFMPSPPSWGRDGKRVLGFNAAMQRKTPSPQPSPTTGEGVRRQSPCIARSSDHPGSLYSWFIA